MDNELRKQAVKHLDEYIEWIRNGESIWRETYPKHLGRVLCVRNDLDSLGNILSFDERIDAYVLFMSVSHVLSLYYSRSQTSKNVKNREDVWETGRQMHGWALHYHDMVKKHTS